MGLTAFITGATGLVGSHLLHQLVQSEKYDHIYCLIRPRSDLTNIHEYQDQIQLVFGDLEDLLLLKELCSTIDHIYHCAAKVSYQPKDGQMMMKVNVQGTADLVNCALEGSVSKFLHISSIAAFGKRKRTGCITEQEGWSESRNNSEYAHTKYLSELEVWRGITEGLTGIILNPSIILGSHHFASGSSSIFHKVYNGLSYFPIGGTGFVDVRDVATFAIRAMQEENCNNQRFILNAGNFTYQEIFQKIAHSFKISPPQKALKGTPLQILQARAFVAKLLKYETSPTSSLLHSSKETYCFNNSKSLSLNGFVYRSIDQTIQETCEKYVLWQKNGYPELMK